MFSRTVLPILFLFMTLVVMPAGAEMLGTEQAAPQTERERVQALVARPEVAQKLEKFGIAPGNARARVAAMTDEEVRVLAGRIDALPAGGATDADWMFVIIIILLLIIAL